MDMATLLILVILAFVAIFGLILIGFSVIVYRQQGQIKKQKQQLQRLHRNLDTVQPATTPTVKVSAAAPSTPIVRDFDFIPPIAQQDTPEVKAKAERKEKELPASKPFMPVVHDVAPPIVQQVIPEVKVEPARSNVTTSYIPKETEISPEIPSVNTELVITEEFKRGLKLMNGDAPCIFVTGKAGTGKSRLLTHFVETTNKAVVLLAPTGMAALKINGQTIHSFFGFPPRVLSEEDIKPSKKRDLYRALDTIVIDEISMVRADLLDAVDQFLRLNGKDMQKPFGGIQMVFFGDLYQLPPVVADEDENKYLASNYKGSFFFDAHVMDQLSMEKLELTKVFRQKEPEFINALNAVRVNTVDKKVLDYINQQYAPARSKDRNAFVTLVTKNASADFINSQELGKIPLQSFTYTAILEGEFAKDKWKKNLPADLELTLKVGARVIFVKNDAGKRWLNGNRGKIIELRENYIRAEVEQEDGKFEYEISRETWELIKYRFDLSTFKIKSDVVGKFTQYPLRLGWAITIHKSQGSTLERVHIDMGSGAFAAGQAYVALSRCRSLEGMTLERPLLLSDIKSDASVIKYMSTAFPYTKAPIIQRGMEIPAKHKVTKNARGKQLALDKIDEEHKYTEASHGNPPWFVSEGIEMVIPLMNNPKQGVDIRKYHGACKIFINGEYRWNAVIRDELTMQSLWKAIQAYDNVSVEPMDDYVSIFLHAIASK